MRVKQMMYAVEYYGSADAVIEAEQKAVEKLTAWVGEDKAKEIVRLGYIVNGYTTGTSDNGMVANLDTFNVEIEDLEAQGYEWKCIRGEIGPIEGFFSKDYFITTHSTGENSYLVLRRLDELCRA